MSDPASTAIRLDPPFRAEHIGSLLRPPALLDAIAAHDAGTLSAEGLREIEEDLIRQAVKLQADVGLKMATDGEFGRRNYADFSKTGLYGVKSSVSNQGGQFNATIPVVFDRIRWRSSSNLRDFNFLKSLTKATPKVTIPGPAFIHFRAGRDNISRDVYPKLDDFWSDLVAAYHAELKVLADAGCTYVQLDETSIAKFADPKQRDAMAARGDNWEELIADYAAAINGVVAGAPKTMRVGMHLCRGNHRGHWNAEGGYESVAETLFHKLKVPFLFLEYDTERAGSFEPLRLVPEDKVIVLGLVSTKTGELEPEEVLTGRIREASRYVGLDRLALSPQCGFASDFRGNPLTIEQETAKLRRIVEISRTVWKD